MNVLVLLGCFALASCALGVLGLTRVSKDRRGLKCYERECLLDPLSLPHKSQQQQPHDNYASAVRSFARKLISPLLLLLAPLVPRVEQGPSLGNHAATSADRIWEFVRQAALQISGLSLLMANQHALPSVKPAVTTAADKPTNNGAEHHHVSKICKHEGTRAPQPTWTDEDDADSFDDDESRESDSTLRDSAGGGGDDEDEDDDNEDEDEIFEDPCEEQEQDSEVAAETDAQRALFDGLQFYTVLSQVGAATVHSIVQQAMRNTLESAATKRVEEQQQASISAIEQRYPDIMCLSAPNYHMQHTTRADLATALLAVTAAAAAMQQQQSQQYQQAQHCGTMERQLSIKRPDTLALAAEDGMEPMRRTPLTSPTSSNQLEASFLQAA